MRAFWVGLLVGGVVGFGGAYLWIGRGRDTAAPTPAAADAGPGAGATGGKQKRRRRRRLGPSAQGEVALEADEAPVVVSAAERALAWRGAAVELPAREVDFAASDSGGRRLSQPEIEAGIAPARTQLVACLDEARGAAEIAAQITLKFLVDERGRPGAMRVRAPIYLLDHGLKDCLQGVLAGMYFASTGAATLVTLPLELK
jgi:hypothetical protein